MPNIIFQDNAHQANATKFAIWTSTCGEDPRTFRIGVVRKLQNGKWIWTTIINKCGRRQHHTFEQACAGAERAIGFSVRFEQVIS